VPTPTDKIHISGTDALVQQPEFVNPNDFRSVIELLNDQEIFIHVLQKHTGKVENIKVTVGKENDEQKLEPYSVITATYSMGDVAGSIGVLGPKRMPYNRVIPLVDFVARTISDMFINKTGT
jgi:heat-inducible transcriptional repressor